MKETPTVQKGEEHKMVGGVWVRVQQKDTQNQGVAQEIFWENRNQKE